MTTIATSLRCQIERVIHRYPNDMDTDADFYWLRTDRYGNVTGPDGIKGHWLCCYASIRDGKQQIWSRGTWLTVEEAAVISTALQMAIDWLAEESTK